MDFTITEKGNRKLSHEGCMYVSKKPGKVCNIMGMWKKMQRRMQDKNKIRWGREFSGTN